MFNLKESFGSSGFAQIFSKKSTTKAADKENDKLLRASKMVELESGDADTLITIGGIGGVDSSMIANSLDQQRNQIEEYYSAAETPEVDEAVDIIINEMVSVDSDEDIVDIDLDRVEGLSDSTKEKVMAAHQKILNLLDFNTKAYERTRDWYVAGRQGWHVVVNEKKLSEGIQRLVKLDPRCLKKVREVTKSQSQDGIQEITGINEYYIYDPNIVTEKEGASRSNFGFMRHRIQFDKEMVAYVDSGLTRLKDGLVPSHLHKALKTMNSLINVEDATVIYAITRAPEKRGFYVDVGTLGTNAAETYMKKLMERFKTNITYNVQTGKVEGEAKSLGIVQDYWLPRREGAAVTEIDTIGGSSNTLSGMMEPVLYQKTKLYGALNIPKGRIEESGTINIGGSDLGEITREEHRFNLFTGRLKRSYATLFAELLRRELILTGVTSEADWNKKFEGNVRYQFRADNFIAEQQEVATLNERIGTLERIEPYVGKIFSLETVLRDVLKMSEEDIKEERKRIAKEKKEGLYGVPVETSPVDPMMMEEEESELSNPFRRGSDMENPLKFQDDI